LRGWRRSFDVTHEPERLPKNPVGLLPLDVAGVGLPADHRGMVLVAGEAEVTQILKVLGCPGAGKSHELLSLLEKELQHVPTEKIGFCTFTRSAKKVILERSQKTQESFEFCRTIHSTCYRQLGVQPGQMVGRKELKLFAKTIGVQLTGVAMDPWASVDLGNEFNAQAQTKADVLLALNHVGRHRQVKLKEALRDVYLDVDLAYGRWFTETYRDWKTKEGLLDYTDLLTQYLEEGQPLPIEVLFIDEAQDLSKLQWQVVQKLGAKASRWYLGGDPDQELFAWAGASAETFWDYPADDHKILSQSYRLPRKVLTKANEVLDRIKGEHRLEIKARDYEGQCREVGVLEPKLFAGSASSFLLFRNHFRGFALAKQLEDQGLPFKGSHAVLELNEVQATLRGWQKGIKGEELLPSEAQAVVAYSDPRLLRTGAKDLARQSILAKDLFLRNPTEREWPSALDRLPKVGYCARVLKEHGWKYLLEPPITLMSIHQAKGQQADRVVLDPVLARKTFDSMEDNPAAEHRVFYTAITRARCEVFYLIPEDTLYYAV
jgi:superfamily I DNA/RNA helicase